jgi:hypothetical protein
MGVCAPAFAKTRKHITEVSQKGFAEGRAWNNLVWRLSLFAEERQLPFRISKSDDRSKASAFVLFIQELQHSFPARFRRHHASLAALAQAISVARRDIKRAMAEREVREINSQAREA